ncbi:Bifunctional monodehydroascorbate reductase and carbonic anhydrase nectarin-3 [Acorus calamus]|uniref:Bifunctional monodehydroascorbate reductase and carbonic anhydrase nectarin-3 n=1 Tax=Acorus calamus TaxID=4465 RepID=A0AAV9CSN2_ACOCL|nr:Bifunctional monodehydroascorbate reductase and carbonic anhydrase nectarin-3 [Acorus calamus]
MSISISSFALLLALLILSSRFEPASAQEADGGFSYVVGSPTGPERWGDLRLEWAKCKTGMMQSPIDIRRENVQQLRSLGRLMPNYRRSDATIQNSGYDIKVCSRTSHGAQELRRKDRRDRDSVQLTRAIQDVTGTLKEKKPIGAVDPRSIYIGFLEKYYRYMGSLTTPPCSEGVVWTVLQKVRFVSQRQVTLLQNAVNNEFRTNNARPLQPLNGRPIYEYPGF